MALWVHGFNFIKLESREWKFYNSFFDIIDTKLHKPLKKRQKNT